MHYPWWYVPAMTSPMLIAAVSVLHVIVSHYAVGGGLFLAVETSFAYRTGNRSYLAYLKDHAQFFILLTVVYGAITGVGIWWTIGLASPLATETLIHTFVFGWAMEYVFFVIEIVAAFIFFYYWGKLQPRVHTIIGWIYAVAAWISLLLIGAIVAFMLNPGDWVNNQSFWVGFFNPQAIPQIILRTGGALFLANIYVYMHATLRVKDPALHDLIVSRSARPALAGGGMILIGAAGWLIMLPESARAALLMAATLNIMLVAIIGITVLVMAMLLIGPYLNPRWVSPAFAIMLFAMGVAAMTTGEFIREAVRKPYIVYNVVMSNQILAQEIPAMQKAGYLESGVWTKAYVAEYYPQALTGGKVDSAKLVKLPLADQQKLGEVLFLHHCNDCHSTTQGYSAVSYLTVGDLPDAIQRIAEHPEKAQFFMPPWAGTKEEAQVLTEYLLQITPDRPGGMYFGDGR